MKSSTQFLSRFTVALVGSCVILSSSNLFAQNATATTDPVGFITLPIAPGPGNGGQQLSFKGLGMTPPVEYQGSAEAVAANTLTDNDSAWTDDQFNGAAGPYYVEIVSNPNGSATVVGTTYDIADTNGPVTAPAKTITLVQNLPASVMNGAVFKVRKHWTIASVFGPTNQFGLAAGDETTADQIRIFNGTGYDVYYYSNGGAAGTGWRKVGAGNADISGVKILPDEGLVIAHSPATPVNVVLLGAVKVGTTSFPMFQGLNIVSNPYAAPLKLKDSGLYNADPTKGLAGGGSTTADQVRIYNGSSYDTYYYSTVGLAGVGWRKAGAGSTNQENVEIPVGASFLVTRRNGADFNWVSTPPYAGSL